MYWRKFFLIIACSSIVLIAAYPLQVVAENLDSSNFRILDATLDGGGGVGSSSNYSLLSSVNVQSDARLTSGTYAIKSGFAEGITANVPTVVCFETTTDSGSTVCAQFPNSNGAIGECGSPGCYNRAKLEIDSQDNPIDTLYLVQITDTTDNLVYYLQSDHTLASTFSITSFQTRCAIQGRDVNDPDCNDSSDVNWNANLQSYNIFGLMANTAYSVKVSALNGDLTQGEFGPAKSATTAQPSVSFDIDVTSTNTETGAPYNLDIGELFYSSVTTASNKIWLDLDANNYNGTNIFARDHNGSLSSINPAVTIPSESEDLAVDPNGNGGYGLKVNSLDQTTLGPLLASNTYSTSGIHQVGGLSATDSLLIFTDSVGNHKGPITGGRASIEVQARSAPTNAATANLGDSITLICVPNF